MTDDGMDGSRDVVERRRQGIRDLRRLTSAFAVSLAGLVVVTAMLLLCLPGN
ncbi:hypothetical protein [Kitasatospora sp. NPDC058218]|uniref:hypothetical protein n=1 Tax=Kitasatospora sp. NPDC058218 TaxID=3346385 RepID=UPI0036D9796A